MGSDKNSFLSYLEENFATNLYYLMPECDISICEERQIMLQLKYVNMIKMEKN